MNRIAISSLCFMVALHAGCKSDGAKTGGAARDTTAPEPASDLAWNESTPSNALEIHANWTHSPSPDLVVQVVQLYAGAGCTQAVGEPAHVATLGAVAGFAADDGASYSFDVVSRDRAGNESRSPCSPTIAVDRTPPATAYLLQWGAGSPFALRHVPATWVRSGASDLARQTLLLYSTRLSPDCTWPIMELPLETTVAKISIDVPADGTYAFRIESADKAGNVTLSAVSSTAITIETGAPDKAVPGAWRPAALTNQATVTASWRRSLAFDVQTQSVQFFSGGACAGAATPQVSGLDFQTTTLDFSPVTEGLYSYTITSADGDGNSTTSDCSSPLTIDRTAPAPATTAAWAPAQPTDDSIVATWTLSPSTDVGAQRVQIFSDACTTPYEAAVELNATAQSYTFHPGDDGTYYFRIVTVDQAGNTSASACSDQSPTFDVAPRPAENVQFVQSSPSTQAYVTVTWVASPSADVASQVLQFYDDNHCGALATLPASATPEPGVTRLSVPVGLAGTLSCRVLTVDRDHVSPSDCSPSLELAPHPQAEPYVFRGDFPTDSGTATDPTLTIPTVAALNDAVWMYYDGSLWTTTDQGSSWSAHSLPATPQHLASLQLNAGNADYAVLRGQSWDSGADLLLTTISGSDHFVEVTGAAAAGNVVMALDVVTPDRIYSFGAAAAAVSSDGGQSFTALSLTDQPYADAAFSPWPKAVVSPANPDRVFYGTSDGILYQFNRVTMTSSNMTLRLPFGDPAGIDVFQRGSGDWGIRVVSRTGRVAESTDGGATFVRTPRNTALGSSTRRIVSSYDADSDFVATSGLEEANSAAYSLDAGQHWVTIDTGACRVRDIALTSFALLFACRDTPAVAVALTESP